MNLPWARDAVRASSLASETLVPPAVEAWLAPIAVLPDPVLTFQTMLSELLDVGADASTTGGGHESTPELPSSHVAAVDSHVGDATNWDVRAVDRAADLSWAPPTEVPGEVEAVAPSTAAPSVGAFGATEAAARSVRDASGRATRLPASGGLQPSHPSAEPDEVAPSLQKETAAETLAHRDAPEPARGRRRSRMLRVAGEVSAVAEDVGPASAASPTPTARHTTAGERRPGSTAGTDPGASPPEAPVVPLRVPASVSDLSGLLQRHMMSGAEQGPRVDDALADITGHGLRGRAEMTGAAERAPSVGSAPDVPGEPERPASSPLTDDLLVDRVLDKLDERLREEWVRSYGTLGGIS